MELLKGLSPASIDSEFRNMAPDVGGSVEWMEYFMEFLLDQLKTNKNYELVQSYLGLFLKVRVENIIKFCPPPPPPPPPPHCHELPTPLQSMRHLAILPRPFRHVSPSCLHCSYFFDLVTKMSGVVTNSAQTTPTQYALHHSQGELNYTHTHSFAASLQCDPW